MGFKTHPVGLANSKAIHLSVKDVIAVALMAAQNFDKPKFTIKDFYKRHKLTRGQINDLRKPPSTNRAWETHFAVCWICGMRPHNFDTDNGAALLMGLSEKYDKDIDMAAAGTAFRKELGVRMSVPLRSVSVEMFNLLMKNGLTRSDTAPEHMVAMEFGQDH